MPGIENKPGKAVATNFTSEVTREITNQAADSVSIAMKVLSEAGNDSEEKATGLHKDIANLRLLIGQLDNTPVVIPIEAIVEEAQLREQKAELERQAMLAACRRSAKINSALLELLALKGGNPALAEPMIRIAGLLETRMKALPAPDMIAQVQETAARQEQEKAALEARRQNLEAEQKRLSALTAGLREESQLQAKKAEDLMAREQKAEERENAANDLERELSNRQIELDKHQAAIIERERVLSAQKDALDQKELELNKQSENGQNKGKTKSIWGVKKD